MSYSSFIKNIYYPITQKIKGQNVIKYFEELKKNEYKPIEELKQLQFRRLKYIIDSAYRNVPYYQETFKQYSFHPDDLQKPEDIKNLPILDKEDIIRNFNRLINRNYKGKIYFCKTSGSTGIPLKFYVSNEYDSWDWASRWRGRSWFNIKIGDPEVAIWGRHIHSPIKRIIDPLKALIRNTLLISGFEYTKQDLKKYTRRINSFNPVYIYGYSNSIYNLALFYKKNNIPAPSRLKAIFVTAEMLFPNERALIESTFNVPVANEYGCSELGGFAHECPHGNWHVSIENVFLEFIQNELGFKEIVATSLTNIYMPFIRYRVGDIGDWIDTKCSCGRTLPIMKLDFGRTTEVIIMKNGDRFSSKIFGYVSKELFEMGKHPFIQYQIIQNEPSSFIIYYVPSDSFKQEDLNIFSKLVYKYLKTNQIKIEYIPVKNINPDPSGKIRYFISRLKSEEITGT